MTSKTQDYITRGPSARADTLLRVAKRHGRDVFDIARGTAGKVLARVRYDGQAITIIWGEVNAEAAKDAIFIHDLELMQQDRERAIERAALARATAPETPKYGKPSRVPQVIVTLTHDGLLKIELPGVGTRRSIPLSGKDTEATLRRILTDQLTGHFAIGEDGAPTAQQVKHWERHAVFPDERCPFCLNEGRIKRSKSRLRREIIAKSGDVEVRRVPTKAQLKAQRRAAASAGAVTKVSKTAEDLGL